MKGKAQGGGDRENQPGTIVRPRAHCGTVTRDAGLCCSPFQGGLIDTDPAHRCGDCYALPCGDHRLPNHHDGSPSDVGQLMPWSSPRHCSHGHPPFTGSRCPHCASASKARADRNRPSARARGYDGKWERARLRFLGEHPLCVVCEREGRLTAASVVDHITPHKGDQRLFWDESNWQPLCAPCHSEKTAREDGGFGHSVLSRPHSVTSRDSHRTPRDEGRGEGSRFNYKL